MLPYNLLCALVLQFFCNIQGLAQHIQMPDTEKTTRIAFGSCNNQYEEQPLWDDIIESDPNLWVWLGDNIYADTDDMSLMEAKYQHQLQRPEYQKLLQNVPVTGIWSDHDFAGDNANKNFPLKEQSQQHFLDFIGAAKQDPVRLQKGIYRTYTLGEGDQKVKLILLDGLYHRDPFNSFFGLYLPNKAGKILGEKQWKWLEEELTNSDAKVHLIASGLQVLPNGNSYTNWSAFPTERKRLLELIEKTKPAIPILLSGDRHVGELSKIDLEGYDYPLFEITSSGMTHHRESKKAGNRYRIGEQAGALNFGLLSIFWGQDHTTVSMQIRGDNDKLYIEQVYNYPVTRTGSSNP